LDVLGLLFSDAVFAGESGKWATVASACFYKIKELVFVYAKRPCVVEFHKGRENMNFLIAMKHYICTGECRGVSDVPMACGAAGCHKKGEPLVECNCGDGKHAEVFEKKRQDMESGKDIKM